MYQQIMHTPAKIRLFSGVGSIKEAITQEVNKNTNFNKDDLEKRDYINQIKDNKTESSIINVNKLKLSQKNLSMKLNNNTYAQIICEGTKYWIECDPHQLINIVDTFWGRYENNMCINSHNLTNIKFDQESNICQSKSLSVDTNIKNFCQNEMKCLVHANESFLSKWNCQNIPKYLQITYQCLHSESHIKTNIIS